MIVNSTHTTLRLKNYTLLSPNIRGSHISHTPPLLSPDSHVGVPRNITGIKTLLQPYPKRMDFGKTMSVFVSGMLLLAFLPVLLMSILVCVYVCMTCVTWAFVCGVCMVCACVCVFVIISLQMQ